MSEDPCFPGSHPNVSVSCREGPKETKRIDFHWRRKRKILKETGESTVHNENGKTVVVDTS